MTETVTISKATLRASGPCSAVSFDNLRCELKHGHERRHQTTQGAVISWPDSERDPEKSQKHEDRIWAALLKGYGHWQPYRESCGDD